jgi:hypothetical protein
MGAYFGSKATTGLCQAIIALMPPHDTYIETHLGGGAIMQRKPAAGSNIGIDLNAKALSRFECSYPVQLIHGCAHRFLSDYDFRGRELVYCDPPYLHSTRTSNRRYRFDYTDQDHIELLTLLKSLPCAVMISGYPCDLYDETLTDWRSLCGSHLLRELVFIIDSNGYAWASNMKRLLQETCVRVAKRKHKKLTKAEYANLQKRYRNILTRGEKEMPSIPVRQQGKRGKIAKSDAHNLWERLKEHEQAVLLFARHSQVSFTNNRAEQDLRMAKVKQKVSGCFRKEHFAKAYCRISSYLQTMANKGHNPMMAIQLALSGQIYLSPGE